MAFQPMNVDIPLKRNCITIAFQPMNVFSTLNTPVVSFIKYPRILLFILHITFNQSAGALEYTDCISAEG